MSDTTGALFATEAQVTSLGTSLVGMIGNSVTKTTTANMIYGTGPTGAPLIRAIGNFALTATENTFYGINTFTNECTFSGNVIANSVFTFNIAPQLSGSAKKTGAPTDNTGALFATEAQVISATGTVANNMVPRTSVGN
jgi:hypothetical protein